MKNERKELEWGKRLISAFLVFSSLSIFGASTEQSCKEQGIEVGNFHGNVFLSDDCFDLYMGLVRKHQIQTSVDQSVLAFGHNNILFVEVDDTNIFPEKKRLYTTGKQSLLSSVKAISLDMANREILGIVNGDNSIFTFKMDLGGNISPIRRITTAKLANATNLEVNHSTDEIMVISQSDKKLLFFKREAHVNGLRPKNSIASTRTLLLGDFLEVPEDVTSSIGKKEIYILDSQLKKIFVYSEGAKGSDKPKLSYGAESIKITSPTRIEYLESENQILISNEKGDNALINR